MSETREGDGRRVWWKEQIKKRLIRQFNSGLVGAKSHHDYMVTLGMPSTRIEFGYNVVHNQYFTQQAEHFRHEDGIREIRPYFLASNRFVERKNLSRLVKAFADCFGRVGAAGPIRDLCLLGDGPLMNELLDQCDTLGLKVEKCAPWESHSKDGDTPIIFFPGFRQIDELPRFYAHAGCFVHPAISEPWGVVINEAMAAGLPVLSSRNVGAAEELIEEGKNGWKFNPNDTASISDCLYRYWLMDEPSTSNFGAQSRLLVEQRCPTSAFGSGLSKILR